MYTKSKVMLLGVITALILALPLAAQTYDPGVLGSAPALSSNTKTATAGIFTTDVDNFINYHKYSGVLKDDATWFGFVTGDSYTVRNDNDWEIGNNMTHNPDDTYSVSNPTTGKFKAGYARNLGNLYLGILYQGNMFQNTSITGKGKVEKTVTLTPVWDDANQTLTQTVQETKYNQYNPGWLNFTNQIEFLVGIGSHLGIKAGFLESLYSNEHDANPTRSEKITDYQNGVIKYENVADEYTNKGGTLKPYLGVGVTLPVGDGKLMPYADLSVDIFSEMLVDNYRSYDEYDGVEQNVRAAIGKGRDTWYLRPAGKIGAKLDLPKKETVQTTFEAYYKIDMSLYSSDAGATGFSGGDTVSGKVTWNDGGYIDRVTTYIDRTVTETGLKINYEEISWMSHSGALIYKVTGEPAEDFRLGFSASLPVSYESGSGNGYEDTHTITDIQRNDGTSTYTTKLDRWTWDSGYEYSNLSAQIDLSVGASYKLIPDRFTINAGIKATPTVFTHSESRRLPNEIAYVGTENTVDELGNVLVDKLDVTTRNEADQLEVTDTWSGYRGMLYGGFMFNFTHTAALDLGLAASTNDFTLDLAHIKVLFSVKF